MVLIIFLTLIVSTFVVLLAVGIAGAVLERRRASEYQMWDAQVGSTYRFAVWCVENDQRLLANACYEHAMQLARIRDLAPRRAVHRRRKTVDVLVVVRST